MTGRSSFPTQFARTGVIGHPITHSLSPHLHSYWMKQQGVDGLYDAIDVLPGELAEKLTDLCEAGYRGVNITLPHKETIVPLLGKIDTAAEKIGAVNTVLFAENGIWQGYNTDAAGFIENLFYQQPGWSGSGARILVLGAGGAARAVLYALQEAGCKEILVANRTRKKSDNLARLFLSVTSLDWPDRDAVLGDISLLVNSTSLGMAGKPELDMDLSGLAKDALVYDLVYHPLMTPLLEQAQNRGNRIVTGLGMLAFQGAAAFEAWFGVRPVVDQALLDHLQSSMGA